MLDPRDRGALLEALRPPPGYVVDSAIATTYSLDLLALLTAPLAFSLFDRLAVRADDREGGAGRLDSFALLHAVRKHAERLVVFCQAGCIGRPKSYRQLLTYLEDAVVQVHPRNENGVFHPKLWLQRLTSESGPVRYRALIMSRNLTFDRSWDTMLTLDGELRDRKLAIGESKPLAEFIEALPELAVVSSALTEPRRAIVATMAEEVRRVSFEIPDGFQSMRFWPLGHDGKPRDPFAGERIDQLLVVSPFLSPSRLESLASSGRRHVLVSRVDELEAIPKSVLELYDELHVLHDAAEDPGEDQGEDVADEETATCVGPVPPARGLHAKLYVADDGWNAHVWTGSANASDAAFTVNVELLVQLTGLRSKVGVDATLDGKNDALGLRTLLGPFVPPDAPVVPNEIDQKLEDILRDANRALARLEWCARVERSAVTAPDAKERFDVDLSVKKGTLALPDGCTVRTWPISLPADRGIALEGSSPTAKFEACSFQALTSFFAFEVTATVGQRVERSELVVRVALEGAPEDRSARVLRTLLDDPAKVLRFLQMLLAADAFQAFDVLDEPVDMEQKEKRNAASAITVPLFESLVRTLEREPDRLLEVDRLIRELRATPEGEKLLPAELDAIWTPIWEAYQSLPKNAGRSA